MSLEIATGIRDSSAKMVPELRVKHKREHLKLWLLNLKEYIGIKQLSMASLIVGDTEVRKDQTLHSIIQQAHSSTVSELQCLGIRT